MPTAIIIIKMPEIIKKFWRDPRGKLFESYIIMN